jgi:hypothetical protein
VILSKNGTAKSSVGLVEAEGKMDKNLKTEAKFLSLKHQLMRSVNTSSPSNDQT